MDRHRFAWILCLAIFALFAVSLSAGPPPELVYDGKRLSEWARLLQSDSKEERQRAIAALGALVKQVRAVGPTFSARILRGGRPPDRTDFKALEQLAPVAVPALTGALWDDDKLVRFLAVAGLRSLGARAKTAVPSLIERLKDKEQSIRSLAAEALGHTGARSAIPPLTAALQDPGPEVRRAAVTSLLYLNVESETVVPILLGWLKGTEVSRRRLAAAVLGGFGPEAVAAVPPLTQALQDEDSEVRSAAAHSLGDIGPGARGAVAALTTALKTREWPDDGLTLIRALARIGEPSAAELLRPLLKKGNSRQRIDTADFLWRLAKSPEAIATLRTILQEGQIRDKLRVTDVLRKIGRRARAALPELLAALKTENRDLRFHVCMLLSRFGELGQPAARELTARLRDEDSSVRSVAAFALWETTKDGKAVEQLARGLQDKDAGDRTLAARLLGQVSGGARGVLPALRQALKDEQAPVRLAVAEALAIIDKEDASALQPFIELLLDKDEEVRTWAATGLGALRPTRAKAAVAALIRALWDDALQVRSAAAEALGRIGQEPGRVVPALIALLKGEDETDPIYSSAVEALGLFGPVARSAVPVIREKLKHPDDYVRVHAALALWRIDGNPGLAIANAYLESRTPRVRVTAAEALWQMRKSPKAISILLEVMRLAKLSDNASAANERYMVARAISRIGPPAKAAVPALTDLLDDEDVAMRRMATEALARVAPGAGAEPKAP